MEHSHSQVSNETSKQDRLPLVLRVSLLFCEGISSGTMVGNGNPNKAMSAALSWPPVLGEHS